METGGNWSSAPSDGEVEESDASIGNSKSKSNGKNENDFEKDDDSEMETGGNWSSAPSDGEVEESDASIGKRSKSKSNGKNESDAEKDDDSEMETGGNWSPATSDVEDDDDDASIGKRNGKRKSNGKNDGDGSDDSEMETGGNWSPAPSEGEEEGDGPGKRNDGREDIRAEMHVEDEDGLVDTPAGKRKNEADGMEEGVLDDTPVGKMTSKDEKIPRKKKMMNSDQQIPRKENIRNKMEMARDAALGNNNNNKRKKRRRDDGDSSDDDDENNTNEESLEVLKRKILGRSVSSMYDAHDNPLALDASPSQSKSKLASNASPSSLKDGNAAAIRLRQDLTCPVCHDRMYEPVSLLCGHSFCRACLNWWLDGKRRESTNGGGDSEEGGGESDCAGTCPTCREPIPAVASSDDGNGNKSSKRPRIGINTALKAVLDALYGAEMNQRRLAEERRKVKARGGEMGGLHARGCEEIAALPEEDELAPLRSKNAEGKGGYTDNNDHENGWVSLHSSSDRPGWQQGGYDHGAAKISMRRNIVLDDSDQRYQLSLGLTKCSYSNASSQTSNGGAVLDVELCLLAMEEDEVDDSGFPAFVNEGEDDEALICTGIDRIHTCIESSVRVAPASAFEKRKEGSTTFGGARRSGDDGAMRIREVTLTRGMIGRDGGVRFRIDLKKALDGAATNGGIDGGDGGDGGGGGGDLRIVKLRFRHADTGAVLELRLPSQSDTNDMMRGGESDGEIEFGGVAKPVAPRNDASRYLNDHDDEDEEHHGMNEYEEDDFLVNSTQDSEEELHSHDEDDEDAPCKICGNGGDLIVCDGGDHEGGCGDAYHVHCIGRSMVPPGDWICMKCAHGLEMDVGIEGHEYEVEEEEAEEIDAVPTQSGPPAIDDSDGGEEEFETSPARKGPLIIGDSDDDDDEVAPVQKKKRGKRKILETLESDSDSS